jgi:CDGSH-type Zn-finger protein/uncharacterized Fe-S cluster protein YjdI
VAGKIYTYESDDIQVQYERVRCIHAEQCVQRLRVVFDATKRPWIQPTNETAEAIAETIHHCPTGALHYTRKDGGAEEPTPTENTVRVEPKGALYVRGDIEIVRDDGEGTIIARDTRVALCRCGASKNKPFCDNSHKDIGFTDVAHINLEQEAVGDIIATTGKLTIMPFKDGCYQFVGAVAVTDSAGQTVYRDESYFCRCGHSHNKPFCDNTHETIGFQAD